MTAQENERDEASAALSTAIVKMAAVFGIEQTARVLGTVAADLQAHLVQHDADVAAVEKARQSGGLH